MKKGITLLLAVFVSSLALTLGLGIFTLLFSEIEFSGTAKESLIAFYAADSGIECAIFWDIEHPGLSQSAFATSSDSSIICNGITKGGAGDPSCCGGPGGFSRFTIPFSDGSCFTAEITKDSNTIIESQGKNICADSAKTVQRGLRVNY